jgi:hypothetical protein
VLIGVPRERPHPSVLSISRKVKKKSASFQEKINGSGEEGWSLLADLTDQLTAVNRDIEVREIDWMEVAEQLEEAEVEL